MHSVMTLILDTRQAASKLQNMFHPSLTLNGQSLDLPYGVKGCQVDQLVNNALLLDLQISTGDAALTPDGDILVIKALQESWQQLGGHYACKQRCIAVLILTLLNTTCY